MTKARVFNFFFSDFSKKQPFSAIYEIIRRLSTKIFVDFWRLPNLLFLSPPEIVIF